MCPKPSSGESAYDFMAGSEYSSEGEVVNVLDRGHRFATDGDIGEGCAGEGLTAVPVHRENCFVNTDPVTDEVGVAGLKNVTR